MTGQVLSIGSVTRDGSGSCWCRFNQPVLIHSRAIAGDMLSLRLATGKGSSFFAKKEPKKLLSVGFEVSAAPHLENR
jgi:hypothetical protein